MTIAVMLRGGRESIRARLASEFYRRYDRVPSQSALADASNVLEGMALDKETERLYLRVARVDETTYIDLGRPDPSVIRVDTTGWAVEPNCPAKFRRTQAGLVLPAPEPGGLLDDLWELFPLKAADRPLILAWLVSTLFPDIPHPILLLSGEQGTGKTTFARLLGSLEDPSAAVVRGVPKDLEQYVVTAASQYIFALDNVSHISEQMSDALCRTSTGEAIIKRQLYTDYDVVVRSLRRPVMITSIHAGSIRGDLAERLLPIELEIIAPNKRRREEDLLAAFEEARPKLLGALLDLAVEVFRVIPSINPPNLPRMADFGRILAAVDDVLFTDGFSTYLETGSRLAVAQVDGDQLASAIRAVAEKAGSWTGTAEELLRLTDEYAPNSKPKWWPQSGIAMGGQLNRLAPALRQAGLEVDSLGLKGKCRRP